MFALDPRENPLRLNDNRLRQLADRLGAGGHRYTVTQLWYAAAAKTLRHQAGEKPLRDFRLYVLLGGLLVGGVPTLVAGIAEPRFDRIAIGSVLVGVAGVAIVLLVRYVRGQRIDMLMDAADFRSRVLRRWEAIYDAPPPGLITDVAASGEARGSAGPATRPVLALVVADASVRSCLVANGVPHRLGIRLVGSVKHIPARAPVAVAHDASCGGYLFAERVRSVAGEHLVGAVVPRPRAAMASRTAIVLRGDRPSEANLAALRATGRLTDAELAWLAAGWWSPLAALPPAALIARVERLVARWNATRIGFLTWP